jgi:hypothetical protein
MDRELLKYLFGAKPLDLRIKELLANSTLTLDQRLGLGEEMLELEPAEMKARYREDVSKLEALIRFKKGKVKHA